MKTERGKRGNHAEDAEKMRVIEKRLIPFVPNGNALKLIKSPRENLENFM